ncbi:hypothetical protein Vadar_008254 [Vaccinium darrowii]|uniref:Uncharacterized protein n=1 Tax=Vaccinium darrowii TaxID=229202 RepID=A0ACB7X8D3_9ERIC|nr:hypothetical protein Vadar_008254 [Vaccinium darrowii]
MIHRNTSRTPVALYWWIFQVVLVLALASIVAWISLIPKNPSFAISDFKFPSSNGTNSSSASHRGGEVVMSTSLNFTLTISNPNKGMGIHYSDIYITLLYKGAAVGRKFTVPGFYQPHKESLSRGGLVNTDRQFWRGIGHGFVELRVCLTTGVRYRIIRWETNKRRMDFEAFVRVDSQGRMVGETNVELNRIS